jgi:translocation and assembly module TamB
MATTDRKTRRKIVLRHATESENDTESFVPPPRRRGRWLSRLITLAVVGLVGLYLLPIIISATPLLNNVVQSSLKDLHGQVTLGHVSLGWFSPVRINNVTLLDANGKPVARAESAASEKTLLQLALKPSAPGRFRIERPQIELVVRNGGSNIEDVLAEFLKPATSANQDGIDVSIEVVDGIVILRDETNGGQWQIDRLASTVTIPAKSTWPMEVNIQGSLDDAGAQVPLIAQLSLQNVPGAGGALVSTGKASLNVERLPLAMFQAITRRVAPGAQFVGALKAKLDGEWGVDQTGQALYRVQGQANLTQFALAAPWLGADQLRIAQLDLLCKISCEGDKLVIEQLSATSDIGQLTCQGTIPGLKQLLTDSNSAKWLEGIKHANGKVSGQIDLAKLAQLLPQTLRVRDDTKITSGQLNVQLTSQDDGARAGWQGQIEASRLIAIHQGNQLSWEQPLRINLAAHEVGKQIAVDRFECLSDFLQLQASGTPEAFRLAGACDLNRLSTELGRFVQLDNLRLAGQGQTNIEVQVAADGQFQANGSAQVTKFELTQGNAQPWTEEQLTISGTTSGTWLNGRPTALRSGQATVTAGTDRLQLLLTGPVERLDAETQWPIDAQLSGAAAAWLRRLSPWYSFRDSLALDGQAQVTAKIGYSPAVIDIQQAEITLQPARITVAGIDIDDPSARLVGAARWITAQQRLEIRDAKLSLAPAEFELQNTAVMLTPGQTGASGKFIVDGDLAKLQALWQDRNSIPSWMLTGQIDATGLLNYAAGVTQFDLTATIQNLVATPRSGQQIIEPVVKLSARGGYSSQDVSVSFEHCDLASDAVEFQTVGRIDRLATTRDMQLTGRVTYDLSKLTRLMQPYLGLNIQLSGRETHAFQLAGPLVAPPQAPADSYVQAVAQQMTGKADAGWQWANFYGFRTGPAKIEAEMGRGLFRMIPTEIAIGQGGKVRLGPEGRLGPGPIEVVHAPAKVLETIEITPEMCQQWLGYVAPLLAGAAEARGRFSLDLDALRIPVGDLNKGDAAGRMTIHDVEIGPGPMIQEIAVLLGGGSAAKLARESVVPFRLAQGRVYHQNLELAFPDVTIRTQGSVGLDQTVSMLIEMPMPARWLGSNPLLEGFKDQVIRLPIAGTLQRPQIDRRALDQVLADMTRAAAQNAVRREVNKGLEGLFEKIPGLK